MLFVFFFFPPLAIVLYPLFPFPSFSLVQGLRKFIIVSFSSTTGQRCVLVTYCYITNYSKLSDLTTILIILHSSTGQEFEQSKALLSLFHMMSAGA